MSLTRIVMTFSLFIIGIMLSGCGPCDKAPPMARQIEGQPPRYQIYFADGCLSLRPRVLRVYAYDYIPDPSIPTYIMVHQWHHLNIKVSWEIIARRPIRADGFEVTIGKVPEGFEQVVPPPDQTFAPDPLKRYHFGFETDWPCYQDHGVPPYFLDFAERKHEKGY